MSKQEIASGAPWKSDTEMTHQALEVVRHGVSIAGLSDGEVRQLYQRVITGEIVAPRGETRADDETRQNTT